MLSGNDNFGVLYPLIIRSFCSSLKLDRSGESVTAVTPLCPLEVVCNRVLHWNFTLFAFKNGRFGALQRSISEQGLAIQNNCLRRTVLMDSD